MIDDMVEGNQALLLKEIDIVQSEIARFDGNGLAVKEWCLAVWAAMIAYGTQQGSAVVIGSALLTTIGFSFIEFTYRRFQSRFIARSHTIEELLARGDLSTYTYEVHRTAVGATHDTRFRTECVLVIKQPHFTLFYVFLLLSASFYFLYLLSSKVWHLF